MDSTQHISKDATQVKIEVNQGETITGVLAGAHTTTAPIAQVEYDNRTTRVTFTGATAVTLADGNFPNPPKRYVTGISVYNSDSVAATVTLNHVISSAAKPICSVILAAGYTLLVDEKGISVLDTYGAVQVNNTLITGNALAFTNTLTTTDGVASGTARRVGGIAHRSIAASTAQLGTTETRVVLDQTYTMPANTLKAGTVVKIRALVFHTATTGSETHTLAVAFGATDLAVTGALDPADNGASIIDFTVVCRTAGATGTVVGCGTCTNGARAAALTATHGMHTGATSASTQEIDTTAAIVVGVAIDRQASAGDTDSCRLDLLTVEIIG